MRRLTAWVGGIASGIAAYRLLRRRAQVAPEAAPVEPDERAEELREKLAESRAAEPAVKEPAAEAVGEEPTAEAEEQESPDERRQRVHEEGRAAIDEMKGSNE
jgi:hypothetical protein